MYNSTKEKFMSKKSFIILLGIFIILLGIIFVTMVKPVKKNKGAEATKAAISILKNI